MKFDLSTSMVSTWREIEKLPGVRLSMGLNIHDQWYVSATGMEIGGDGFLTGVTGTGDSPQQAVVDLYIRLTTVKDPHYIKLGTWEERLHFRRYGDEWVQVALMLR